MRLQEETGMPVTVDVEQDLTLVLVIDCGPKNAYAHRVDDITQSWWREESLHLPGVRIDCPLYCGHGAVMAGESA